MQECAQELARCLADGGERKGTEAYLRIQEIISARVRAAPPASLCLIPCSTSQEALVMDESAKFSFDSVSCLTGKVLDELTQAW